MLKAGSGQDALQADVMERQGGRAIQVLVVDDEPLVRARVLDRAPSVRWSI